MTIVLSILGLIVLAVVVLLIVASQKPDTFRVERSIVVNAPPAKIFPYFNDFMLWPTWSPYEKKDPAMQRNLSGPTAGKGAVYEWKGNKNVGHGRMEILDAPEPSKVVIKLDFFSPMEGHNTAEFTMAAQGSGTLVTWAMYGPAPMITKVLSTVMNFDKMVGTDFEVGLANVKAQAEK